MVTVLRRVREPRQKSDESLRADVNKMCRTIPIDCSLAQWSVISLLSPIRPSGQYTERVLLPIVPEQTTLTENFVGCCTGRSAGLSPPAQRLAMPCAIGILCRFC